MTTRRRRSTSAKPSGGLTTKAFGGLNKKNYTKKATTFGQAIRFKAGERVTVQFAGQPDDPDCFKEFYQHSWKDGQRWYYVPCAGDDCPLCEEEDREKAKTTYRFIALVYNFGEKKTMVMEGPKDLAGRIMYQWERKPERFTKKVFDVMPLDTQPRTYQVDVNEDITALRSIPQDAKNPIDLDKYLELSMKSFYGDDGLVQGRSSLDDDDDVEDDDDYEETPVVRKKASSARKRRTRR